MLKFENSQLVGISDISSIHNLTIPPITPLDFFNYYSFNKCRLFRDSFGLLNTFYSVPYKQDAELSVHSMPCLQSFEELCDARINELSGRHLTILWSGGCDSSTMVAAAIRNNLTDYEIVATDRAIKESPRFYQFMIKQGLPVKSVGDISIFDYLNKDQTDSHYLNGCPEQIFQYPVMTRECQSVFFDDWHDGILSNLEKHVALSKTDADAIVQIFEWYLDELGLQVLYTIDLFWLYLFSGMYIYAENMFASCLDKHARYLHNFSCFYRTDAFAYWALTHSLHHYPVNSWFDNPLNYRREEKRYIQTVFDDYEIASKTKVGSQTSDYSRFPSSYAREISVYHDGELLRISTDYTEEARRLIRHEYFNH